MKKTIAASAIVALVSGLGLAGTARAEDPPPSCTSGQSLDPTNRSVVGLTSTGGLVCFRAKSPGVATAIGSVTGLTGDTSLVGIDFRVQDGVLYGVGNAGGIYTLSTADAAAAKVGQLSVALSGTSFGVDFNPAANALRIVSNDGQNLRVPFNIGTAPGTPNPTTNVDTPLNTGGSAPTTVTGVVGAAYTNNDLNASTNTSLFDLNAATNQVMLQSPANSGQVVATGTFTPDATDGDLDVYTTAGGRNVAYALITTAAGNRVYKIDLLNGQVSGNGAKATGVLDIALPINQ